MAGTILEFIILLVAHASAGIFSSTLKFSKKTTYIIWGAWVLAQIALLLVTEFVLKDMMLQFFVGFIMSLIGQYVIFFMTTKGRLAKRIFTMMTYSIFFCIATGCFMVVRGTFPNLHWAFSALIQAALLLVIMCYFLHYVCPLCRAASKNITTGWTQLLIVNAVFLIMIVWSSVYPAKLTDVRDANFAAFAFLSLSIMVVYPVIFSNIYHMSEAAMIRQVETQNRMLLAQVESETVQLEAASQARHDRRHHNLIMLEFARNNDIENVREYLRSLVETDTQVWSETSFCDNLTVNTILSVYERRAREQGITTTIRATASRNLPIVPQDLVIVIANIFENAIHGASKQKSEAPYIDITIKESPQRLLVIVKNSCRQNLVFDEHSYGVGIRSIISTANKYKGMYDFAARDGEFSVKVSLNLY